MRASAIAAPDRAIVIGGSMAGQLAARVLADRFAQVLIVDRDTFPDEAAFRKGVPQSRHLHVLLARGAQILEELLPGFQADLAAAGAVRLRWPADAGVLGAAGWATRRTRSLPLILSRRELVEHMVRRHVQSRHSVELREGTEVIGLLTEASGSSVTGVRIRSRQDHAEQDLEAGLVVDASGRGSRAPAWLEELGCDPSRQTVVNSFLGYASRTYTRDPTIEREWRALFLQMKPPAGTRGGGLFPIDGDQWLVTLAGIGGDYPPTDEPGFLEFARSLRSSVLYEAIRDAEPTSAITGYRRTENQLRHFDELRRWPEGFLVIGDAACCFNPIYGQGMTVAATEALVFRGWLKDGAPAHDFQRRLAKAIANPWLLATGEDFRYPTTEGGRPNVVTRLMHRYLDRINATSTTDPVVAAAFNKVVQMVARPTLLFHPEVVIRTLRGPGKAPSEADPLPPEPHHVADPEPRATGLREGWIRVDAGVRLHYVESGDGALIVLLHGFPEFWYSWRHQLPALAAAGYRAVAVDLRGYNLSDKPRGVESYLLPTLARDIQRLIRTLGSESASVVGHDWGALVGWELAMRHPDVVERLAILNLPHPERMKAGLRTVRQLRKSWYIGFYQLPVIPENYLRWGDFAFIRRALGSGSPGSTPDDIERYIAAIARPGALRAGVNYYRALARLAIREPNRSVPIEAPVLVIWGEQDPYLGAELAEAGRRWVPNLRMERLPDAGHWLQIDRPEIVNPMLLDFLRARELPSSPPMPRTKPVLSGRSY
jgi:pimeloyl-ACP methyl ester carboxylesterase/2-polyprenyl-6-methoxyphenol hydroxylase-like FAD-dependent oxidoreductase